MFRVAFIAAIFLSVLFTGGYLGSGGISKRHDLCPDTKDLCRAWHVRLPGYETHGYPEDIVDLRVWMGTRSDILRAEENGKENPEATAGVTLQLMGLFTASDGYQLKKQEDGHWVLYRPAKEWDVFTWSAWYRIGPWELATKDAG